MMNRLAHKMAEQPRHLFLIDGLGAIVTASLLAFVVAPLEAVFGMPSMVAYKLATIAIIFAIYSMINYNFSGKGWRKWLRIIASANACYCIATLVLLLIHWQVITLVGILYFLGEALIVAALVVLEYRTAAAKQP